MVVGLVQDWQVGCLVTRGQQDRTLVNSVHNLAMVQAGMGGVRQNYRSVMMGMNYRSSKDPA